MKNSANSPLKRLAIITGAGSGLGRALTLQLAGEGWHVAMVDCDAQGLEATADFLGRSNRNFDTFTMDVASIGAWEALAEALRSKWQHLDLLVNNAGVGGMGSVTAFDAAAWPRFMDVNFLAQVYACKTLLPWMGQNPGGASILNVASVAAFLAAPFMGAYSASKAAVLSFSRTLRYEAARHNIAVTVLCPYFFRSNLMAFGSFQSEHHRNLARRAVEQSKFGPEQLAAVALRGVAKKRFMVTSPFWSGTVVWYLSRLAPDAIHWLFARKVAARNDAATYAGRGSPATT